MNFIEALTQEIDRLKAKLNELERLRHQYEMERLDQLSMRIPSVSSPNPIGRPNVSKTQTKRHSQTRLAVIDAARNYLRAQSGPRKTVEIQEHILKREIKIGGANERNTLSAMLHHHDDFVSHGRAGWTLKENEATPVDASVASETDAETSDNPSGIFS